EFGNSVGTQEENSIKADHVNLYDENVRNTPKTPTPESCEYLYFTYTEGNGIDVVVPVESILAISKRFVNIAYGFFLGKRLAYPVVANYNGPWFIRNHPLILRKWNPDDNLLKEDDGNVSVWVKLHGVHVMAFSKDGLSAIGTKLDNIVVAMLKFMGKGYYKCTIHVEYEWKPPKCLYCKVFGHTQEECPKNIILGVVKNLKKLSQTSLGVSVGPKMGFKPHKEYRPIPKKPIASPSGTTNLVNNGANSSGSSIMNVKNSSTSNIPIIDKIKKFEDFFIDGQAILVDEAGNPLKKVECLGDYDSEDENGLIVVPEIANSNANQIGNGNVVAARAEGNANGNNIYQIRCYNCRRLGHLARNCTDAAYLQTQLLIVQKEEARIQIQAKEFDLMATVGDLDEIVEVNANCILMANLQQASTSDTQTDKAPVYDSDGSAEYIELLEPILEPHQAQQNNSNVIYAVFSVEQSRGTVEQHPATVEKARTVPFGSDHITAILGYADLKWGNILIARSKDEAPEEIKIFLKNITILLQAPVIINDRKDIGKLGAKGDIGFFIELDLTYAPSTITTQKPTERELDLLFEAMYDDYIGGQPSSATRTAPAAQAPQVL
nr:hypothetical protein [Tanacetum cinerariifolium]